MGRFWGVTVLGVVSAVLGGITLIWQEWIEFVFGVDPDRGDGSLEWVIVAVLAVVAVGSGLVARWEWRRTQAAS